MSEKGNENKKKKGYMKVKMQLNIVNLGKTQNNQMMGVEIL